MSANIVRDAVFMDTGFSCLARIVGPTGAIIVSSNIDSIVCNVFDLADPSAPVVSPAVVVADCVFDTLQTDSIWKKDDTGYNFRHAHDETSLTVGGHRFRIEYLFKPSEGAAFALVFELKCEKLFS